MAPSFPQFVDGIAMDAAAAADMAREQYRVNSQMGDASFTTLSTQLNVTVKQVESLLYDGVFLKRGCPRKMTDEVKGSLRDLVGTGLLNRDDQFAKWLSIGHGGDFSR